VHRVQAERRRIELERVVEVGDRDSDMVDREEKVVWDERVGGHGLEGMAPSWPRDVIRRTERGTNVTSE
jgi:hypothetical protein